MLRELRELLSFDYRGGNEHHWSTLYSPLIISLNSEQEKKDIVMKTYEEFTVKIDSAGAVLIDFAERR